MLDFLLGPISLELKAHCEAGAILCVLQKSRHYPILHCHCNTCSKHTGTVLRKVKQAEGAE